MVASTPEFHDLPDQKDLVREALDNPCLLYTSCFRSSGRLCQKISDTINPLARKYCSETV